MAKVWKSKMFELDKRLAADCEVLGELPLSLLLLMNDANYPWLILVPRLAAVREIVDLNASQRQQLLLESCVISDVLLQEFKAHKLNVAALGNMVPQLHMHHVARFEHDAAWPKPVWGVVSAVPYSAQELSKIKQKVCAALLKTDVQFSEC